MGVLEARVSRTHWAGRLVAASLAVLGLSAGLASAQALSAPALKAAYLFNFAQFVEWPAGDVPAGESLTFCIVSDSDVADVLEQTIKGRSVQGHGLSVRRVKLDAPLPTCHVLFLGGSDLKQALAVVGTVKGVFVLTISDSERFAEAGGMVELFRDKGLMRFAVNVDTLKRARIQLSSRVLSLAKIVRDPTDR